MYWILGQTLRRTATPEITYRPWLWRRGAKSR